MSKSCEKLPRLPAAAQAMRGCRQGLPGLHGLKNEKISIHYFCHVGIIIQTVEIAVDGKHLQLVLSFLKNCNLL